MGDELVVFVKHLASDLTNSFLRGRLWLRLPRRGVETPPDEIAKMKKKF